MLLVLPVSDAAAQRDEFGTVHFPTSCKPAVAPQFDRAVALMHSFEFGASIRAFSDVLAADSTCAMAQWGIALSRWSNPFSLNVRPPAQLEQGLSAIREAEQRAPKTERERAYVAAAAKLYQNAQTMDQRARVLAYSQAMADPNSNDCSSAMARSKSGFAAGVQDVSKCTVPSFSPAGC